MSESDLRDAVLYQLGALDAFAQVAGREVAYVKPHGALYQAAIDNEVHARAVVAAAAEYDPSLAVLGFPGSALLAAAHAAGLEPVPEAFIDRSYLPDGRLVPRSVPGALKSEPADAAEQAVRLATTDEVVAADGSIVPMRARSLCVHGDSPQGSIIATEARRALEAAGVGISPFAG
ncbi:hypothetical protein BH24ACT5_BH24ACT5_24300 [soil metagenome]